MIHFLMKYTKKVNTYLCNYRLVPEDHFQQSRNNRLHVLYPVHNPLLYGLCDYQCDHFVNICLVFL